MNLKRVFVVMSALVVAGISSMDGQIGTWRSYTSMLSVRDHARIEDRYWVATGGGLFGWQEGTESFETFTNAEGLLSNDLTAIGIDSRENIWVGASSGIVHVLSGGTSWNYILDIFESSNTSKRINGIVIRGDTVLICTEFGLSMFDAEKFVFGDTYSKFGSLTDVRVEVADAEIFGDSLWVVVSGGTDANYLAVAALSNPNRLPPESWILRTVGGLTIESTGLEVFGNQLYAGTSSGLYLLSGGTWSAVAGLETADVVALRTSASALMISTTDAVYSLDLSGQVQTFPFLPFDAASVSVSPAGTPVVGSSGGLLTLEGSWTPHAPNGPGSNQFLSVVVDPEGRVWGASGFNGSGKGIYRFDGVSWKTFTKATDDLPTDDYYRVSVGCNGSVWASSWGWGVAEFPKGAGVVDTSRIFGQNVGLEGLCANPLFVVVSDVVCDQLGNEWMSINQSCGANILAVRHPDGETWTTHPLKTSTSRVNTLWFGTPLDRFLAVDALGNLWGGSRDLTYQGVFTIGNRGAIADSLTALLTEQDGLPGNEITTLAVDRDNDIWIGTEKGIGIILDPADPTGPGGIAAYKPLNGLVINAIAVDPLNRKWVATPEGVIVLSADGIQVIESYSVETTGGRLIANDVRSISIDDRSGTVYFGTLEGLSSLTTVAAGPKEEFDKLVISPNPFVIPSVGPVVVDGLVENSIIKILTIDGKLVREIFSPGGRVAFWDGKDEDGDEVSSGIYIVVAYSEDGSKLVKGKVAVVRQ